MRSETRQRILHAAIRTLAEQGYARTTARAVAATGGFAPGAIYYHFADLDELFVATARFTSDARLAEEVRASTAVWQDFAASTISRLIDGTPFAALVPVRELATAAVAAYLGMEMLSHLDIDRTSPTGMFDAAERAAAMFEALRPR